MEEACLTCSRAPHCCCCLVDKLCLTLFDPMGHSLPGSSVHGIAQARTLKWVAISFSRASSRPRDRTCLSCIAGGFFSTTPPGKPLCYAVLCLVAQACPTLCDPMDCSPPCSSVHGDSPGNNAGVGCHALFQGIFPIQGSNPGLPHCRQILYCLSHQGSP